LKWEAGYLLIGGGFALWLLMKIKLIPAGFLGVTVFDGVDWGAVANVVGIRRGALSGNIRISS